MAKDKNLYTENSIITETPREFTRRTPATYLGSQRKNTNLIKEIFANSCDEASISHGDIINVTVDVPTNTYIVEDFGQGFLINAGIDEDGETILQRSFDKMNTSGKTSADGVYEGTALGLNGIGAKLTNWLSLELDVISHRDGKFEHIWFRDGVFNRRKVGDTKRENGTIVTWHPDPQFFTENEPDETALRDHFEIICALLPNLTINFTYNGKLTTYHEPGGLNAYVNRKVKGKELFSNRFVTERTIDKDKLSICITYTSDYTETIDSYVNLGHTESGMHIQAFHTAFTKAINKYANDVGILKKNDKNFNTPEISAGLYVSFNLTTTSAKYDAQSKTRIDDVDAKIINAVIGGDFATWLMNNPSEAKIITERALTERKSREAAQKAKEKIRDAGKVNKKSIFVDLPSKLSDAYPKNKKDRSECELYICLKGETKIKLLDETTPTIESLVGKTNLWAYSTDSAGAMIPAKITEVFKTQDVTKMLKLTFDDGSTIECTPEHKFLDRDSCTWVEAKDTYIGQSMFCVKTKVGETINTLGRPLVWIPTNAPRAHGRWVPVHRRVAEYLNIAQLNRDIHHIDFNPCNNSPENLIALTKKDHLAIHNRYNHDSGRMNYKNKHFTDESRKRMQTAVYRRSKKGIEHQREAVRQAWKNGRYEKANWKYTYNQKTRFKDGKDSTVLCKILKRARAILDNGQELCETTWLNFDGFKFMNWNTIFSKNLFESVEQLKEEALNYNLKVVKIEEVLYDEPIPVYCLNIDNEFHSFVLDNGLITHNCEGDSACSSISAVKDSAFQAVFPIRGKILNCQKASPDRVYANAEIANITKALGLDIDKTTGKLIYNIKKLRYNKIIFATDADADGSQIAMLLCTVFNWLCPELFTNGHIYRVYGALYKATFADKSYKLFQNDFELETWKKENPDVKFTLTRAKGLGEMTRDETFEQLVDPSTRNLKQLVVEDYDRFIKYIEVFEGIDNTARKEYYENGILPE